MQDLGAVRVFKVGVCKCASHLRLVGCVSDQHLL